MRPVVHGDVVAAARVLWNSPDADHARLLARLLNEARWADAWRKRTGRAHPLWGDGTLMAAALMRRPGPEPSLADSRWLRCLATVLEGLVTAAGQREPAQETHSMAAGSISSRRAGISSPHSMQ